MSDIKRSFKQYKKHQELQYLKLNMVHKIILSVMWIVLLPTVILSLKKKKKNNSIFVIEYTNTEPFVTIYEQLKNETSYQFVSLDKYTLPHLPWLFIKDITVLCKKEPLFFLKNLDFLGALALKIAKYNRLIQKHDISYLIVWQEYSFYSSYLTRTLEYEKGKLYNIQHGIPGETYSFFRFSKTFVWGEYYKEQYIQNGAQKEQFVISGSIFHYALRHTQQEQEPSIDVLYIMQGYVRSKEDTMRILQLLEALSSTYTISILQHPRHRVPVAEKLKEFEGNVMEAISSSHIIVSRYSTAMLDALYMGKCPIAFIGDDVLLNRYIGYLPKERIITSLDALREKILEQVQCNEKASLDNRYINPRDNPIKVIHHAIHQDISI